MAARYRAQMGAHLSSERTGRRTTPTRQVRVRVPRYLPPLPPNLLRRVSTLGQRPFRSIAEERLRWRQRVTCRLANSACARFACWFMQ